MEGLKYPCTTRQKSAVEVDQPQEFPQLALCGGSWEVADGLDFLWQGMDPVPVNEVTKEF